VFTQMGLSEVGVSSEVEHSQFNKGYVVYLFVYFVFVHMSEYLRTFIAANQTSHFKSVLRLYHLISASGVPCVSEIGVPDFSCTCGMYLLSARCFLLHLESGFRVFFRWHIAPTIHKTIIKWDTNRHAFPNSCCHNASS